MATDSDGTAQPTEVGADSPVDGVSAVDSQTQADSSQFAGFQKRIDELTAKYHASERKYESDVQAMQQSQNQLLQALLEQRNAAPTTPEPPPFEIEEDERRKMEWMVNQQYTPQVKKLEQHIQQLEAALYAGQVQQAGTRQGIDDPEVLNYAAALSQDWARKGYFKTGVVTSENALELALGRKAKQELMKKTATEQKRQFNQLGQPIEGQGGPPAPARKTKEITYDEINADPIAAARALRKQFGLDE